MIKVNSYYGKNPTQKSYATMVKINDVSLYFSYDTLVAFDMSNGSGLKIIKNYWGPTTDKHLNAIDGGGKEAIEKRMEEDQFNELAEKLCLSDIKR